MAIGNRERSDPDYRDGLRCDSWETVVPELVFEPNLNDRAGARVGLPDYFTLPVAVHNCEPCGRLT